MILKRLTLKKLTEQRFFNNQFQTLTIAICVMIGELDEMVRKSEESVTDNEEKLLKGMFFKRNVLQ